MDNDQNTGLSRVANSRQLTRESNRKLLIASCTRSNWEQWCCTLLFALIFIGLFIVGVSLLVTGGRE